MSCNVIRSKNILETVFKLEVECNEYEKLQCQAVSGFE